VLLATRPSLEVVDSDINQASPLAEQLATGIRRSRAGTMVPNTIFHRHSLDRRDMGYTDAPAPKEAALKKLVGSAFHSGCPPDSRLSDGRDA